MKKHPPSIAVQRARKLRGNPTDAERHMWSLLRQNFPEARFRRQVPLRHYIADFPSHRHRLVVELDGGQHNEAADAVRTKAIEGEGYAVVRFWNHEVMGNGEGCMTRLAGLLRQAHPHPAAASEQARKPSHPSPIKGEGK